MQYTLRQFTSGCVFLALLFSSMGVQAHPRWILPSEFTVSGEEAQWISFDLTASHSVFEVDKGISAENVRIYSPDGDQSYLRGFFTGHRRSVFDVELRVDGTYKVQERRPVFYYTGYKTGKKDTVKYIPGNKVEVQDRLPSRARDVRTEALDMATTVYVTKNAPSDSVLEPTGKGLEILPVTHPNDLVENEEVVVKITLDGKPAAGVEVEITPNGTRYRDERRSLQITTDETGIVSFSPDLPGPWLMAAIVYSDENSPMADVRWSARYLTFEVIPQ